MYQQCPICKGKGYIPQPSSSNSGNTCPTCKGHRIISELTGLPPQSNKTINDVHKKHPITNFNIDNNIAKEINEQFDKYPKTLEDCFKWLPDLDNITEENILNTIKYIQNNTEPENIYEKCKEYVIKSKA